MTRWPDRHTRGLAVSAVVLAVLAVLAAWAPRAGGQAAAAADEGTVVLTHDAYWRIRPRYGGVGVSDDLLASEGEKTLGAGSGLLKIARRYQKQGWRLVGGDGPHMSLRDNGPPPGGWMKPDFDDATWPRCRRPDFMGRGGTLGGPLRAGCFRGAFHVADPAACGKLTLRMRYRGGARVFLNGTEIARGHLPAGPLGAEAAGATYPLEAYIVLKDEFTPDLPKPRDGLPHALWPEVSNVKDFDRWESGPGPADKKAGRKVVNRRLSPGITRATIGRLVKLRSRSLGPLVLPSKLLRKGANVLAVEFRSSPFHPVMWACGIENGQARMRPFSHGRIDQVELRAAGTGVPSALKRPAGVQVWVEDVHARVFNSEYLEPGAGVGVLRIVAARNGTYSGQIVVGTDRELAGVRAVPSALAGEDGATIPASAWAIRVTEPDPVKALLDMGMDDYDHKPGYQMRYAILRHGPAGLSRSRRLRGDYRRLRYFDRFGGAASADVAANSCRPLWARLTVPASTRPGRYRGTIAVQAKGARSVAVPAEVEVIDWILPDAKDFATVVAAEQSPYGLARHYKVAPWSDRHFELMEPSFRLLGRLGNDWLFVPVLSDSEFGNRADSPIKWIRKKDGTLKFEYTAMDRYLALAVKHWGKPRVISFVIAHGNPLADSQVQVFDEATGKTAPMSLGVDHMEDKPLIDAADKAVWRAFAKDLHAHMRSKGLGESMYWGFTWDADANKDLVKTLQAATPGVYWTRGSHYAGINKVYKAVSQCYGFRGNGLMRGMGWRNPGLWLQNSRRGWFGCFVGCAGVDTPFMFRYFPEQALTFGHRGIGRIGADYWGIWREGCQVLNMAKTRGRTKGTVGFAINSILSPAADAPESSARLEALAEGLQQAEARVLLEKALVAGALPAELAERVKALLAARSRATGALISSSGGIQCDYAWAGWQERSRALYALAAEVARTPATKPATRPATRQAKR